MLRVLCCSREFGESLYGEMSLFVSEVIPHPSERSRFGVHVILARAAKTEGEHLLIVAYSDMGEFVSSHT